MAVRYAHAAKDLRDRNEAASVERSIDDGQFPAMLAHEIGPYYEAHRLFIVHLVKLAAYHND